MKSKVDHGRLALYFKGRWEGRGSVHMPNLGSKGVRGLGSVFPLLVTDSPVSTLPDPSPAPYTRPCISLMSLIKEIVLDYALHTLGKLTYS